jgi:glucose/arabinose dehydrogenase
LAFLGPDDFLVLEKSTGRVKRVVNGNVQSIVLELPVNSFSERGLLGIALHPDFDNNHVVYIRRTCRGTVDGEREPGSPTDDPAAVPLLGNRVDRFVWDGSMLTFDSNVIQLRAYQADAGQTLRGNHNGGKILFGPDGKLYIYMGDNGRRGWMQNVIDPVGPDGHDDQFGGQRGQDASKSP